MLGKGVCMSKLKCSFCGKSKNEVKKLIAGQGASICNECMILCNEIIERDNQGNSCKSSKVDTSNLTPAQIKEFLDEHIVNQESTKKILSVAVFKHFLRIQNPELGIEKSNIILSGPSGCGKTYFAQTIAKYLNIPHVIADATSLTEAGYVGLDVESMLSSLYRAADCDMDKAEKGIIFIDEIDKIAKKSANPSVTKDVGGEGVQQALLKLIEGTEVAISDNPTSRQHPNAEYRKINTKDILFIASGAFVGLQDIVASQGRKEVTPSDLYKFGLIPEFVGRFPIHATLVALGVDELKKVLTQTKGNLISQYKKLFSLYDAKLIFTEAMLESIATRALALGTGARGLRMITEELLLDLTYNLPEHKGQTCVVDVAGTEWNVGDKKPLATKSKPESKPKKKK